LYWKQLEGEKHLLYVPNQGHGINDYARVIGSLSALHRSRHSGGKLPELNWEFSETAAGVGLDVTAKGDVDSVRGWVAHAASRDFRDAQWVERVCQRDGEGQWSLAVAKPAVGFVACFAECVSGTDAVPAFFSTNLQIFAAQPE
jgi:PhoPQ-activated pathogenicity-related protein